MSAARLQAIVLRLSNSAYCRHWLHWNYPAQRPWLMAIRAVDATGQPHALEFLRAEGFTPGEGDEGDFWLIERTDEDGAPFTSPLG